MKNEDCIFCKIVAKEIPAHIVYEDSDFLAFLDIRPMSPGHTLIIPKDHYRWVWDLPAESAGKYFQVAQKVALSLKKAFGVDCIMSKIVGEEVPHAHIWVYADPSIKIGLDAKDFEGVAKKLGQIK